LNTVPRDWHAAGNGGMTTRVTSVRRPAADGIRIPDFHRRIVRALTVAIDREQADAAAGREAEAPRLPLESRLRIATFFVLACGVLFLPFDGSAVPRSLLASLLLLYAAHAALTSVVLIASLTAPGERHADALALLLVVGHAVTLHVHLWLWPRYPGLTAGVLACLLVGSGVLFSWSTARVLLLATAFCTAFVVVSVEVVPHEMHHPDFAVAGIVLIVGAATAVGCARLLAVLRGSLAERQRELTELSARLMAAQEEERHRLARDLHDEFGQTLTAVNAYLWLLEHQPPDDVAVLRQRAAEARRLVNETLASMRELSQLLRPSVLDTLGLIPSLEALLASAGERYGLATRLTTDTLPERLPAVVETALYRVAQEALTNVARHARARTVRVALACVGDEIRLEVEDDGVGLAPAAAHEPRTGTGLVGIRERVRALGGQVEIVSRKGVRLSAHVPLAPSR
jgi:signal transduction histidine kinase